MEDKIECMFSCDECGIRDQKIYPRVRQPDEDVAHWMEQVFIPTVARVHKRISPRCRAEKISEGKIPTDNRPNIGGPKIN